MDVLKHTLVALTKIYGMYVIRVGILWKEIWCLKMFFVYGFCMINACNWLNTDYCAGWFGRRKVYP